MNSKLIKDYFFASNYLTICEMYLKEFKSSSSFTEEDLKEYNPGHLGSSISTNYLLANLYYFLKSKNLSCQTVIGAGHAGASLLSNLWLNGKLPTYYSSYSQDLNGLNKLIADFGTKIRSEINPEYPETIYDGGELGYSLGVSYGYAINSSADVTLCLIGDGEAETGVLSSSWLLAKSLDTKSKVFPILNLNGFKMGSESIYSLMSDEELTMHFKSLGYSVKIISKDDNLSLEEEIEKFQKNLNELYYQDHPLLIVRYPKGYTLPDVGNRRFEGNVLVHKNPLSGDSSSQKYEIVKRFLEFYQFDFSKVLEHKSDFNVTYPRNLMPILAEEEVPLESDLTNIKIVENFLMSLENCMFFSPDEIVSNQLLGIKDKTFEILNEALLQALYQGYTASKNQGIYISYEGFMPIIESQIAQYYKYLKQIEELNIEHCLPPLIYLLTSTSFENTYSHQNPNLACFLLSKDDKYCNVLYPKDGRDAALCINKCLQEKNKINVITTSKRHFKKFDLTSNIDGIDLISFDENADFTLVVTGDYMLDLAIRIKEMLKEYKINIIYITNPKILDVNSSKALSPEMLSSIFSENETSLYLFSGFSYIIKSLLYDRGVYAPVLGYEDGIPLGGSVESNLEANGIGVNRIVEYIKSVMEERKNKDERLQILGRLLKPSKEKDKRDR